MSEPRVYADSSAVLHDNGHDVWVERIAAHRKHRDDSMESAPWDDPTGHRLRVLLEEVGEVAREFNDARIERREVYARRLWRELIQVAAMAAAWADACNVTLSTTPTQKEQS